MQKMRFLCALIIFLPISPSLSQSLQLGVGGGAVIGVSPHYLVQEISEGGFGMRLSYAAAGAIKFAPQKLPIVFAAHFSYAFMRGHGYNNSPIGLNSGDVKTKANLFSLDLGAELPLSTHAPSPYVGLYALLSSTSLLTYTITSADYGRFEYIDPPKTRVGVGIGGGVQFNLFRRLDLDLAAKLKFRTLFGKQADELNFNSIDVSASILFDTL